MNDTRGFTLIELSIVLVIIGLIIGGVLVGRDMIKNAEIRATISQIEKYKAAVNTFRGKYGGLPGDLNALLVTRNGLTTRTGAVGHGDGNGLLEACGTGITPHAGCETLLFWNDLSFAQLVEGSYTTATDDYAKSNNPIAVAELPLFFPAAKIGRGNYFTVFSDTRFNYYELVGLGDINDAGAYSELSMNLTPMEAFNIDSKMDDGIPGKGIVQAMEGGDLGATASDGNGCRVDATTYDTAILDEANTPACALSIQF